MTTVRRTAAALTQSSFDRLLFSLDPDRDRAGEQYEVIRRKLVKFFECRTSPNPEDDADETISRVARRIEEGEAIQNLPAYFYGVARLVLLEAAPAMQPEEDAAGEEEARLGCLQRCLEALPGTSRELLVSYYLGDKGGRIRQRHQLAANLGIPMNALRIRMHRLRATLEDCVTRCLGQAAR